MRRHATRTLPSWTAGLLLLSLAGPARAIDQGLYSLVLWAHEGRAQRNRADADSVPRDVQKELLEILASGARGCDCRPRLLRWAWALPRPQDPRHPSIAVAFEDRLRESGAFMSYLRFAMLVFREDRYVVSGVLSLRRPHPSDAASGWLHVRLRPRQDLDEDGQLDIALSFDEKRPAERACGEALFASSAGALSMSLTRCGEP